MGIAFETLEDKNTKPSFDFYNGYTPGSGGSSSDGKAYCFQRTDKNYSVSLFETFDLPTNDILNIPSTYALRIYINDEIVEEIKLGEKMSRDKEKSVFRKIALAYLIITINFNLESLNIIPNWLGYFLFYQTIDPIADYQQSAKLLKPLILILGVYELLFWILTIFGITIDIYVVNVIVSVISLYFHFQLLTNIADIFKLHRNPKTKHIYFLRTIKIIMITVLTLPIDWPKYILISLLIVNIFIVFYDYDDEKMFSMF